ncbi:DODA-type extradiol aromatic ring-opening family dioxygenase [Pseudomonas protegens]|uniref:DODA-type extradiol aromatic ring-opening family dioxygenase n=1 Tax=Pseudomonas protegens TaxID=380021 RepID=UPI003905DFA1
MRQSRLPTYYLSHGGGPWSFMDGPFRRQFAALESSLEQVGRELADAATLLVMPAHWETEGFAVSGAANPSMVYDYVGFPGEMYSIQYQAPGQPSLAERVRSMLHGLGAKEARVDPTRGFDHGTFSILKAMFPLADKPVVQLSLDRSFDPGLHMELGRRLASLRDEGVAIIGSGQSFQNLAIRDRSAVEPSAGFDAWLQHVLHDLPPDQRGEQLIGWQQAPFARLAHPREEHLLPLMVVVGAAANDDGHCIYQERLGGFMTASSFRFGQPPVPAAIGIAGKRR